MTLRTVNACRSFREGRDICADGFVQSIACRGAACHSCGRVYEKLPMCLSDDFPDRSPHFNPDGSSRYYPRTLDLADEGGG